jgi:hypothetical protein
MTKRRVAAAAANEAYPTQHVPVRVGKFIDELEA